MPSVFSSFMTLERTSSRFVKSLISIFALIYIKLFCFLFDFSTVYWRIAFKGFCSSVSQLRLKLIEVEVELTSRISMATGLEIIVGTYEEFLLGYRVRPSRSVSEIS
jgi:hypothetical protein